MSLSPRFRSFSKSDSDLGDSYLRLICAYDTQIEKLKKEKWIPKSAWDAVSLTDREPTKALVIPHGYDQSTVVFLMKSGLKTFALHDGLRKAFSFDGSKTKLLMLEIELLKEKDEERVANAIGNLLVLSTYEPMKFGKKAKKKEVASGKPYDVVVKSGMKFAKLSSIFEMGLAQAKAANLVRTLAELPGNELGPKAYRAKVEKMAKQWKVGYKFFDQKMLEKRGANGFLAVVRSTPNGENGIVHLHYKPKGKANRRIALVGKGLCFDTGGYNIKVGEGMNEMHRDMTGSAVTLALFGLLVESGSKDEIHAYMALAENLISPTAYRPNDVVVASNGVSIEVVDTDAEGRMALSDTLVLACESNPDVVVDFATLTGAVIRALDTKRSGVFSNSDELRELAVRCGDEVGERAWGFPIGDDYWDPISSDIADVRQCATSNCCDHIYAATFLSAFVKPEIPWLHVDLASESNKGGLGLSAKDVTGFGIRLVQSVLNEFKPKKKS